MTQRKDSIDRRSLLAGSTLATASLAAGLAGPALGSNAAPETGAANEPKNTKIELANEAVVKSFCDAWSKRDVELLITYLTDDIVYQVVETLPLVNGKEEFRKMVGPFLSNFDSVRWDTLRSYALGRLVVNERIDYFEKPKNGEAQIFAVVGEFLLEKGKIKVWKDWSLPTE